jgi:hypothetical protein
MVNFFYTYIYEVLQQATPDYTTLPTLNRLKAKSSDYTAFGYRRSSSTAMTLIELRGKPPPSITPCRCKRGGGENYLRPERHRRGFADNTAWDCPDSYHVFSGEI